MKDRLKIAFLDTIGLPYTGDTLTKRGLGGSESAVIYLTKELVKLGFQVDVYNRCEKEGGFNNVNYYNLEKAIDTNINYDILISSRSCLPFAPDPMRDTIIKDWRFDIFSTKNLVQHSKYKVVWLHDTFCQGDGYLEDFARAELFNEIFTLSDWHSDYTLNGHQWRYRYYEVLKRKIWQTRNGIHSYIDEVDIKKKNPNQFVYTSAVTKGLIPLLENIWEKVYNEIPNAKLKVVGGYYAGAGANGKPDAQELKWRELKEKYDGKFGIEFTGLVTQQKVAEIVAESSLMIYPALFPETFGMSVLEAINYNTPVITCRFGALEEVAVEKCCYLTDYEVSNPKFDIKEFILRAVMAHKDAYLRQQKAYACNELKPWIGWDSVAMQWKEHFYKKLGLYLNVSEIKRARKINYNVNSVFNMRFVNEESNYMPVLEDIEKHILIISPFYNSEAYLKKCIESVASQLYNNYTMVLIDDASTDDSANIVEETIKKLPKELQDKFIFMENNENVGAIQNQINNIIAFTEERDDNSIIVLLDGDDALTNNPDIFNLLNHEYATGAKFTYGSMHSIVDNINLIAQPYSQKTKEEKIFKEEIFNWGMPYTHLRTFSAEIFKKIDLDLLKDENGNFYRAGGDGSLFYALLDQCEPHEIRCIQKIICEYNDKNPLNDYKVNQSEQTKNGNRIMLDRRYGHGTTIKKNKGELEIVEKDLQLQNNLPEPNLMDNLQHIYQDVLRRKDDKIALYKYVIENRTDTWLEDPNNLAFATRFNWILSQLDALEVKITSKILDIGAWTGTLANYLNTIGYKDITCVDISKNAVKMGTEVYPNLKWYQGDIEKLELFESYDIIILGNVLQHLINPYETLNKIKEHLNFNGKILFTVPTETHINPNGVSYEHVSTLNFGELKPICEDLVELQDQNIAWYAGRITKESMEKGIPINNIEPIKTSSDKKRILIAMPTAKYIESETFMSIYKLKKPENLQVDFQCFYGYNVAQVRNLIANYAILGKYDWVFWVDSDIILPEDSLIKLLSTCDQGADFVTGIYRQRKEEKIIPEIYVWNDKGGMDNILPENIPFNQIVEIAGCGLGCAITSVKLIEAVGYPQFEYHNALKKEDTLSEDIDFCLKAMQKKFHIYADTSIKCLHIGNTYFRL